jgi:hypothetical protein
MDLSRFQVFDDSSHGSDGDVSDAFSAPLTGPKLPPGVDQVSVVLGRPRDFDGVFLDEAKGEGHLDQFRGKPAQ